MRKEIKGYEGDTLLLFNSDYDANSILVILTGQAGYKRKAQFNRDGHVRLIYENPFSGESVDKMINENKSKYTFENLSSMKEKEITDKSLHQILEDVFDKNGVEVITD